MARFEYVALKKDGRDCCRHQNQSRRKEHVDNLKTSQRFGYVLEEVDDLLAADCIIGPRGSMVFSVLSKIGQLATVTRITSSICRSTIERAS